MDFSRRLRSVITGHLRDNFGAYCLVVGLLLAGIVLGALANRALGDQQKTELLGYLQAFFQDLGALDGKVSSDTVARNVIISNLRNAALIWLSGVLVFGLPIVLGAVCIRGFAIGFTVGFLVREMGYKGILFALASLMPHNLFALPAFVVIAVTATAFAISVIRSRISRQRSHLAPGFLASTGIVIAMCGLLVIGGAVEAYVSPVFMKLLAGVLN